MSAPTMPKGIKLRAWNPLKGARILRVIRMVTNTETFCRATLERLGDALAGRPCHGECGCQDVNQLIGELKALGVEVEIEETKENVKTN